MKPDYYADSRADHQKIANDKAYTINSNGSEPANSPSSKDLTKPFLIFNSISFILLIIILGIIAFKRFITKNRFQFIYYISKIATIKSIILENHYSEILDSFTNSGQPTILSITYRNLLKLVNDKNECISNYKPCGILDTYGNVLCIDELLDCPINKLKIDSISKSSYYSDQNYRSTYLNNTDDNYRLFFSNNFNEGNIATTIIKTKEVPKYLTNSNFILDTEAFEDCFGNPDFIDDIADIFGLRDDEKEMDAFLMAEKIITIFKKIKNIGKDEIDYEEIGLIRGKLLYKIISHKYNKTVEKFNRYVKDQIEMLDSQNIDHYFEHIGGNFYAKNYIGFKSVEDITKFMGFDHNIYKKQFPSFKAAIFASIGLVFIVLFLVGLIICITTGKKSDFCLLRIIPILIQNVIYYAICLVFIIHAAYRYIKVNKNSSINELKSVKSDKFINSIIDDFVSQCQDSSLIVITFTIIGISIILNIISIILYFKYTPDDKNYCCGN